MSTPTSRRFSSSSFRRLWLQERLYSHHWTITRTCRRLPGYFSTTSVDFAPPSFPMIRTSTPDQRPFHQEAKDCRVADFRVVDQQLPASPRDKRRQPLTCILRTHDESIAARRATLTGGIRVEQLERFVHESSIFRHDPEAAASRHVEPREV